MRHEPKPSADLRGITVLVIEDEFYLATDLEEQIVHAGGTVLGPCRDVPTALTQLDAGLNCAVVDINLGQGPSFEIAEALQKRGIPFFFLTGYDAGTIPSEFSQIKCIEKPAEGARVIDAIASLAATRGVT